MLWRLLCLLLCIQTLKTLAVIPSCWQNLCTKSWSYLCSLHPTLSANLIIFSFCSSLNSEPLPLLLPRRRHPTTTIWATHVIMMMMRNKHHEMINYCLFFSVAVAGGANQGVVATGHELAAAVRGVPTDGCCMFLQAFSVPHTTSSSIISFVIVINLMMKMITMMDYVAMDPTVCSSTHHV